MPNRTPGQLLEEQLRELGSSELALQREISELPTHIRAAYRDAGNPEGERLEMRLRQAREEAKELADAIKKLEGKLYTMRHLKSHDRSR